MKKTLICFLVLLFISSLFAIPEISFITLDHDFGKIKEENGPYSYIFKFTNTGDEDLRLTKVKSSCGCTVTGWSTGIIHPKEQGEIKVSYTSNNRPSVFHKTILVNTNISDKSITLNIYGDVIPTPGKFYPKMTIGGIQFDKKYINVNRISDNEEKEFFVTLYNSENYDIKIKVDNQPKYIKTNLEKNIIKPKEKCILSIKYKSKNAETYGQLNDKITFNINGEYNGRGYLIKSYRYKDFGKLSEKEKKNAPYITLDKKRFNFSYFKNNRKKYDEIVFTNIGNKTLKIFNINHSSNINIIKNPTSLKAGEKGVLKFEIRNKINLNNFRGFIKIYSNDPLNFETGITISGKSSKNEKNQGEKFEYIPLKEFLDLQKKMGNVIFLKELLKKNKVSSYTIIDVRSSQDFKKEHFASSQNLPLKTEIFDKYVSDLDKENTLYYVIGNDFDESNTATKTLKKIGIKHLICVKGGYKDFKIKK